MNNRGIEYRAARISLVNGLATVLTLVFQLVSVPVCLHYWGQTAYGGWLALLSAFTLLRSLDSGFVTYVGNQLNVLYHEDLGELHRHLSSAIGGVIVIGSVQLAIVVAAAFLSPLAGLLGMGGLSHETYATPLGLLVLMLSWVLTGSYIGILHRLQIPAGMMYQAAWWGMALQIGQFGAIILAASLRFDLLQTSLLFALLQSGIYIASAFYLRQRMPAVYPWLSGAQWRVGMQDLRHSLLLTCSNIVTQGGTSGAVLLVAAFSGAAAVPVFTTARTLANLWTSVTTVLTAPLLPEVVRIHVKREARKLASISQVYWVLIGSAVNLGALLSYPLIPLVYSQWTAHAVALDKPLLCALLGSVIVANAGALTAVHLAGINRLGIGLHTALARAACTLGVGALGFRYFGLSSFGIGILIGECCAAVMNARQFVMHELGQQGVHFPRSAFVPILVSTGTVLVFFLGSAAGWWSDGGWMWVAALICVGCAGAWGWRTLDNDVRLRLSSLTARWLPARS